LTSFRSGLLGISETAGGVVADSGGVGGTVALSSGLDPDDGVDVRAEGVGPWAQTEASTFDVAPVAPCITDTLHTGTALVDDEGSREAVGGKLGCESGDVLEFISVGVALDDLIGCGGGESVVVGNVGGKTLDTIVRDALVDVGEHRRCGIDVCGPSEPSSVTSIEVEPDVALLDGAEDVLGALLVSGLSNDAVVVAHVGDHVGEGIGLNDSDDTDIGVGRDSSRDGVDVGLVLVDTIVVDVQFTVGGLGVAIRLGRS